MENKFGPIKVQVALTKTDPEIIKKLYKRLSAETCNGCRNPYKDEAQVKELMRYNVWTVDQFMDVSGFSVSTITNMARPAFIGNELGTKLDYCFPWPDKNGRGPKFIVRNEKAERYIKV
jgi:hypothetical protein